MPGHDRSGNEGTGIDSAALVAIEDFGGEVPAMEHFYRTMLEKDRRRPRPDRRSRRLVHRGRYRDGRCARADAGSVRRLRRRLRTFLVSDRAVQGYGAAYVRRLENLRRQGVPESARGRTGQVFRVGQRLHSPAGRDGAHGGRDFPQAYRCGARGADSVYQSGQHLAARRGQRLARARFPARPESSGAADRNQRSGPHDRRHVERSRGIRRVWNRAGVSGWRNGRQFLDPGQQRAGAVRDHPESMRGSANCSATIWSCCSTG